MSETLLEVRRLDAFYGRARILDSLSLGVARGEVVVLLGRNGAGKSTTLKSVMGIVPPAAGEVTFVGARIDRLPPFRIARLGLGYVPEDRRVFAELTVEENLEVARRPARPDAPAWTTERVFALFPPLVPLRRRAAGRMSGGEQQMLTIARTLMGNPRMLLLDEPSEGLAPVVIDAVAAAVAELKREQMTILLSEQNLRFAARIADRAYVIERGRIRFDGRLDELLANAAVREAHLGV